MLSKPVEACELKVKIIESSDNESLEKEINKFLKEPVDRTIYDIQCQHSIAMDNEGVLTIGIKDLDNDRISCFIQDTGKGMEKTIREQVFSPFFTTKSADKGTGLGLYIVKNICRNHNVEIRCESEAGKGTVFNLLFPLTENVYD